MSLFFPKTVIKTESAFTPAESVPVSCKIENGKLVPKLAPERVRSVCPADITFAARAEVEGFNLIWADGVLYATKDGVSVAYMADLPATKPFIAEEYGEDGVTTYIVGSQTLVSLRGGVWRVTAHNADICGGVYKSGRYFGIDKSDPLTVRWSGEQGVLDWNYGISGAGWLKLKPALGKILNLVNFNDRLVAVRSRGLTVISAYGTPENFKAWDIDTPSPEIAENTAAVAGGKLVFYAGEGLYSFDGTKITPLISAVYGKITSPSYAVGVGSNYYICGGVKPLGGKGIAVVNTENGSSYYIDFKADALVAGSKIYAYGDGCSCYLANGGEYSFTSGKIDFGTVGKKSLTNLDITAENAVEVRVESGGSTRVFKGAKGRLRPHMCGCSFKITVKGRGEISAISASAEVANGI